MTPFATIADLEQRHPTELVVLAADESTGYRDDVRVERALEDATAEIRGILKGRYSSAELASLDEESLGLLRTLCMDIALYRVSLSFARSTEALAERYRTAIKRLEGIVAGKGALTVAGTDDGSAERPSVASPNEALIEAPERMFTRSRMRGL